MRTAAALLFGFLLGCLAGGLLPHEPELDRWAQRLRDEARAAAEAPPTDSERWAVACCELHQLCGAGWATVQQLCPGLSVRCSDDWQACP